MFLTEEEYKYVKNNVRQVPDHPKKGIIFLDITTVLKDKKAYKLMLDYLEHELKGEKIDKVVCIEARGFIFGAALADRLNAGCVIVRKPNKLPCKTVSEKYFLEYGHDELHMHVDAVESGERVLVVDDLLATGGTAEAAVKLVSSTGARVVAAAFPIELTPLKGRGRLEKLGAKVVTMLRYNIG